jgi:hypothetical protein
MFIPAYCGTTYKYQGATINENYNIHDTRSMNRNHMYVALSRCTDISQVHCDDIKPYYKPFVFADECESIKPITMKDGYIYAIKFNDNTYYVGETMTSIDQRLYEHENYNGTYVDSVYDKKDMIEYVKQIAKIPVEDKSELRRYESYWIQHYEQQYGRDNILNKKQLKPLKKKKTTITINKTDHIEKRNPMTIDEVAQSRFNITNDIKNKQLRIQYRDSNKKKRKITKRYTDDDLDCGLPSMEDAMDHMTNKRKQLIIDLYN